MVAEETSEQKVLLNEMIRMNLCLELMKREVILGS